MPTGTVSEKTTRYQRTALRAMNVLEHFSRTGKIHIRFPVVSPPPMDSGFSAVLKSFVCWLHESDHAASTIHVHERVVARFLDSVVSQGLKEISSVNTGHVSTFILEITAHRGKVSYELNSLRVFFRYLYQEELIPEDLILFLPATNRLSILEHLPSIWGAGDVEAILRCIDRGNPVGSFLRTYSTAEGNR